MGGSKQDRRESTRDVSYYTSSRTDEDDSLVLPDHGRFSPLYSYWSCKESNSRGTRLTYFVLLPSDVKQEDLQVPVLENQRSFCVLCKWPSHLYIAEYLFKAFLDCRETSVISVSPPNFGWVPWYDCRDGYCRRNVSSVTCWVTPPVHDAVWGAWCTCSRTGSPVCGNLSYCGCVRWLT